MEQLKLRKANAQDELLLFCWANDPVVRANSFSTGDILLANHKQWYMRALNNPDVQIYIMERGDLPVGQVRTEMQNGMYVIGYSIDAAWRGCGYGRQILSLLEDNLPEHTVLAGRVKGENMASRSVFLSLGYKEEIMENCNYIEYRKSLVYSGGRHSSLE